MRALLIMNPGSRDGRSRARFDEIFAALERLGVDYEHQTTEVLDDAHTFSRQANESGKYDAIVAVGGDGTINGVLRGFFNEDGTRNSTSRMGIIYTGTSPDFCKSHGIPLETQQAVEVIASDAHQETSIGMIKMMPASDPALDGKFLDDTPGAVTAFFGCCANIGLGATLAEKANTGIRKKLGDFLGTFLSLLQIIFTFKAADQQVRMDGEDETIRRLSNISVGKTHYIASGIQVENDVQVVDDRFYLFSLHNLSLLRWLRVLKTAYSGRKFENREYMSLNYARKIEFAGNARNPQVEFDGDPAGYLPCTIVTARDTLDLLCLEHQ